MNTIRELEQQEKYKNMLKRKNKEIKRLNNIIKQYDKVSFIHEMELQKRIDKAIEYLEVREYETECCEVCDTMSNRILEILNKGE